MRSSDLDRRRTWRPREAASRERRECLPARGIVYIKRVVKSNHAAQIGLGPPALTKQPGVSIFSAFAFGRALSGLCEPLLVGVIYDIFENRCGRLCFAKIARMTETFSPPPQVRMRRMVGKKNNKEQKSHVLRHVPPGYIKVRVPT